jgi:hypothetical protein
MAPLVDLRVAVNASSLALTLLGYISGTAGGYVLSRRIVRRITSNSFQPRLIVWLGVVGGLVALLPAVFLAMVVGASAGGGIGAAMDETFALKSAGAQIGFPIGVAVVFAVVLAMGVAAGASVGRLAKYVLTAR